MAAGPHTLLVRGGWEGHHPQVTVPEVRTIVERGLLWATRVPA
jgi:type 1 glutamine amidotransferase